ncbi:MAG: beta-glucosidase H [Desertimonas sp.]
MTTPTTPADLSVEQKVALLAGVDTWHTPGFDDPPVPAIRMSDGPAGARGTSWRGPASASFPCGSALGATWDVRLINEVGKALGREARSKNADVLLAPTVNLHRTPISGRNFEFPSEDPLLASEYAVAYVTGVQHEGVACCIKHFVANETEHERMTISSEVDQRTLRELYLAPFEAAVTRANVRSVMSAYNRLNGTYCSEHEWLLTDVLRGEWGFDGAVISDWFGMHSTVAALSAGCDVEMPGPPRQRGDRLLAAVASGDVDVTMLDRAVERVLALARWTGAGTHGDVEVTADDAETVDVMRRAATRAMVLLKNDDAMLPIASPVAPATGAAAPPPRLALIGPYARFGRPQGGGSARVTPTRAVGPLDALRQRGFEVELEPGGSIARYLPSLRGEFAVQYVNPDGSTVSASASRLAWFWDQPPAEGVDAVRFAARISGSFTPSSTGDWEFGVRAIGPVALRLDGATVVEVPDARTGGAFFGMGSPEVRGTVAVEEGRSYELVVELGAVDDGLTRGLVVGAGPVSAGDEIARAAAAAARADVAVVIVGTDDDWETEGEDRTTLALPGDQDALISAVAAANRRTMVVVNTGSPITMPWLDEVTAVLQIWFPGQSLGEALADVITGVAEPGGRLAMTFPRRLEDTPAFDHYPGDDGKEPYGERLHIGYRWYDRHGIEPLFAFGHGLGYTSFDIVPVGLDGSASEGGGVTVEVTNTGDRAGGEVVQVYVAPPEGDDEGPLRRLAAFARVDLEPGARERVRLDLPSRVFASWLDGGWTVPPGHHTVSVGRSSRDHQVVGLLDAD